MLSIEQQMDTAFAICKWQAATDGAFPEELLKHWFEAAWNLCAGMAGFVFPPFKIVEPIHLDHMGRFWLSHRPSSEVRIYAGYTLIAVLPPSLERTRYDPSLCCHCNLSAHYTVGNDDPCAAIPPRFVQAVARVFAYMVENRGDVAGDDDWLTKTGAMTFLSDDLLYVA